MATYTLNATVHESVDIALDGVTLGRYNGDTKEADLTPVYVDGGYNARNYTATDTLPDSTGRRWRWTATDIYGNSGSATIPRDRALVWTDIVTCEDARIQWSIEGTALSSGSITVSTGGSVVKTVTVTQLEGNAILGGGLDPDTTYYIALTASVDSNTLTASGMFHTEAFVDNYFCIENKSTTELPSVTISPTEVGNLSVSLEYSFNKETWREWTGSGIILSKNGSKVYFRGTNGTLSTSASDYLVMAFSKKAAQNRIEVSGDANFLLSRRGGLIATPSYAFYRLFATITNMDLNGLKFGGKVCVGTQSFKNTFSNSSVSQCPTFDLVEINNVYSENFHNTFSGTRITSFDPFPNYVKNLFLEYTCSDCNYLTTAAIKAANTFNQSFLRTFRDCGALQSVTVKIPSITGCAFDGTFSGCTALTSITSAPETLDWAGGTTGFTYENNWLVNASSTGTFHKPQSVAFASAALPVGWTIANDVTV